MKNEIISDKRNEAAKAREAVNEEDREQKKEQ